MEDFRNKVAESGIITLDPAVFYPPEEIIEFDLKDFLFMGLILKEKEFREALKNFDTHAYSGKIAAVHCSADAIIPVWAYMLVSSLLTPVCSAVIMGNKTEAIRQHIMSKIALLDGMEYKDKRVVIKGCGELDIPADAYLSLTNKLRPFAKSIMYGEPCSTVPVYKRKEQAD
jgi:hypothetical protein